MGASLSSSSNSKRSSSSKTGNKPAASKAQITDVDKAVLSLKTTRKKLADQSELLQKRMEHNWEVAKELVAAGKRERAVLLLKKRKLNEKTLENVTNWQLRVEETLASIEMSQQQGRVFAALSEGNAALKQLQKECSLEDVQRLMDDSAEAAAMQAEIADLLAGSDAGSELTLAAEEELRQLEELSALEMPSVPAKMVPAPKQKLPPAAAAAAEVPSEEEEASEPQQATPLLAS